MPAIVAPGCLDMVNFHAPETVPAKFAGRTFYQHNPQVTLMRTNAGGVRASSADILAEKVNLSTGPVTVLIPQRGDQRDQRAGPAVSRSRRRRARSSTRSRRICARTSRSLELDATINDPAFAEACANTLLDKMHAHAGGGRPA